MAVTPFEVTIDWKNNQPAVCVCGELDFATVPALEKALRQAFPDGAEDIIFDFKELTFLDSEGLKILIRVYRDLSRRGHTVRVRGCNRLVSKTFEILGLGGEFGIGTINE